MQLSELLLVHERLDQHFAVHQEHLLDRRLPEARATLDAYIELLGVHMRHEEERLLPIYGRGEPSPRFPLVLFTGQHQRMRELLAEARSRLSRLGGEGRVLARGVIELLDFERTYKHLGEHHDGAERQALFPALDRLAQPDERTRIGAECLREWLEAERRLTQASSAAEAK